MRILIGYDDSFPLEKAIRDLARAGLPAKIEAVVLSVATAWGHTPFPPESRKRKRTGPKLSRQYRSQLDHAMREALVLAERGKRRLRESFPAWGIKAEAAVDDAAEALLEKAGAWHADLIVVGSGRSPISRLFLGHPARRAPARPAGTVQGLARPYRLPRLAWTQ